MDFVATNVQGQGNNRCVAGEALEMNLMQKRLKDIYFGDEKYLELLCVIVGG